MVTIARPRNGCDDALPESITTTFLEAREAAPPPGKTALLWRLLTTHAIDTAADAEEIVNLYRLRWRIEQLFRSLKSDGLALEDSQVIDAERLFNLTAIALAVAIEQMQLVDARDGSPRPASDVVDNEFAAALERLSCKLEGATAKQKILTRPDRWPSSHGSQHASAGGIAKIMESQDQRPSTSA